MSCSHGRVLLVIHRRVSMRIAGVGRRCVHHPTITGVKRVCAAVAPSHGHRQTERAGVGVRILEPWIGSVKRIDLDQMPISESRGQ